MSLTEFDEKKYEELLKQDTRFLTILEMVERKFMSAENGAAALEMDLSDFRKYMQEFERTGVVAYRPC